MIVMARISVVAAGTDLFSVPRPPGEWLSVLVERSLHTRDSALAGTEEEAPLAKTDIQEGGRVGLGSQDRDGQTDRQRKWWMATSFFRCAYLYS